MKTLVGVRSSLKELYALKNIDLYYIISSLLSTTLLTLTLFNLYNTFSVLQCDLIAVLFIISSMSNFNSYQDLHRIL